LKMSLFISDFCTNFVQLVTTINIKLMIGRDGRIWTCDHYTPSFMDWVSL